MRTSIVLAALAAASSGCGNMFGGSDQPPLTHTEKIDVGGGVVYAGDPSERLAGVTVTLTDLDGDEETAVTSAQGLWTIENLRPGVYAARMEAAGYETATMTFALEAYGEDDVKNTFIAVGDVGLQETRLTAVVSGVFSAALSDGDAPRDGFAGNVFVYSAAAGGDVVVTFSRVVLDGEVRFIDFETGEQVDANRTDTATQSVFTISGTEIVDMNGNLLTTDNDPYTFARIEMNGVDSLTPIHGDFESFDADLFLNAVP